MPPTMPPPLSLGRRTSSLDEDTADVLAHLEESSPGRKQRTFFPSPRRHRSTSDLEPPDDAAEAIIEGAEEGRLPRLLPEGDRAALIEKLRTDLFEVQRDSELTSVRRPSPLPSPRSHDPEAVSDQKLGTFKGVFLPCLQNILGIILYLRLTWITGQAGTLGTTGIVLICACSTFLTALSLSAIATNGRVDAGGPYFVISRNLGPEVGVAVGILFYLGTTIAASMYVLGAVEMLYEGFAMIKNNISLPGTWDYAIFALVLMALLAMIVRGGVQKVNAAAPVFLSVTMLSIVLLLLGIFLFAGGAYKGALSYDDRDFFDNVEPDFERTDDPKLKKPDFQSLIALFYPSVTGIMAGCNRSGVLANPSRSIPIGTLAAIGATTTLYLVVVWAFGSVISHSTLLDNPYVCADVAWPHPIIVKVGIVMSSLGAALQSLTGAPRLLSAIAGDGLVPFLEPFAPLKEEDAPAPPQDSPRRVASRNRLSGDVEGGTPPSLEQPASPTKSFFELSRINTLQVGRSSVTKGSAELRQSALLLTWFVASVPCLAGNLDAITPIITMFFLLMYATINCSCFAVAFLGTPGFRPTWRCFHWSSALLGCVLCLALMFAINWIYALVAIFIGLSVGFYVRSRRVSTDWGDAGAGFRFQVARDQLLALTERSTFHHAKNWRPQILVLCRCDGRFNPVKPELLALAGLLKKGRGLLMAHSLIDAQDQPRALVAEAATEVLRLHLNVQSIQGFPRAVVHRSGSRDVTESLLATAQSCGVGALRPNSVLLGWPSASPNSEKRRRRFVQFMRDLSALRKALVVLKEGHSLQSGRPFGEGRTLDVWWVVQDGGLLLLLPFLLKRSKVFAGCQLRLFAVMTGLFAHHWNADHGGASAIPHSAPGPVNERALEQEQTLLERWRRFIESMLVDLRIDAEVHPIAGLDFVWAAAHVYRDTLGLRGRTTYAQQLERRRTPTGRPPASPGGHRQASPLIPDDNRLTPLRGFAQALNAKMRRHSSGAALVVTNLPYMTHLPPAFFVDYVDAMTDGLGAVLLVRGSGQEVVTKYG